MRGRFVVAVFNQRQNLITRAGFVLPFPHKKDTIMTRAEICIHTEVYARTFDYLTQRWSAVHVVGHIFRTYPCWDAAEAGLPGQRREMAAMMVKHPVHRVLDISSNLWERGWTGYHSS